MTIELPHILVEPLLTVKFGRHPHTGSKAERILELNQAGVPNTRIAETVECSVPNVTQTLNRYGRKHAPRQPRPKPDAAS